MTRTRGLTGVARQAERQLRPVLDLLGLRRVRHPPGTAPGTLPSLPAPPQPARARAAVFGEETLLELDLLEPGELPEPQPGQTRWIDIEGHDVPLIAELGGRLRIHPLVVEDVAAIGQRPKVEEYPDCLFVVLHRLEMNGDGRLELEQVSLVIQEQLLLSARQRPEDLFAPVRERLRGGKPRIRKGGPGYLAYALIDTVVDHYFPVLDQIGDRIVELEFSILDDPTDQDRAALHALKRDVLMIRRSTLPVRDMVHQLLRLETPLIRDDTRVYLRDVADHVAQVIDVIDSSREMISSLTDLYMSSVSNRMNEVMKVLTIIATLFIPLSFIAGVYGMNFDPDASPLNMPELKWKLGYPVALALMAAVAAALLLFFRRRRWL